jgi:ribosomal-protein-alanine N-acetyltransferase
MAEMRFLPFSDLTETQWQQLASTEASSHFFPWSIQQLRDCFAQGYITQALLDEHSAVAGYSVFMANVVEWELLNITLAPSQRGKGLGRQLLAKGLNQAQAAGVQGVFLEVRPSNAAAVSLYTRMGFKQVGLRKHYYRTANPAVQEAAWVMRFDCPHA